MTDPILSMWTVYDHPSDDPEHFVARRWDIVKGEGAMPSGETMQCVDVEEIRRRMEADGKYRLNRAVNDDPVIMEVWL